MADAPAFVWKRQREVGSLGIVRHEHIVWTLGPLHGHVRRAIGGVWRGRCFYRSCRSEGSEAFAFSWPRRVGEGEMLALLEKDARVWLARVEQLRARASPDA